MPNIDIVLNQAIIGHVSTGNSNQVETANVDLWQIINDQIRGYYSWNGHTWECVPKPVNKAFIKIALILESPHKDEFDNNFNPLSPLNGTSTRKRFANKITAHLNKWFNNQVVSAGEAFEIKLINPVQYQTSFYHFLNGNIPYNQPLQTYFYPKIDCKMRNNVWLLLFNQGKLSNDFINRMTLYNPDYIINCCTGKNYTTGSFLTVSAIKRRVCSLPKATIKQTIRNIQLLQNALYTEDKHPSIW